jgi:hypothetical protein
MVSSLATTGILGGVTGTSTSGITTTSSAGLALGSIDPESLGDDGGWEVTATGLFPLDQGVTFRVQDGGSLDVPCYSGVIGSENVSQSEDGVTARFTIPPLPIGGPYDIYCESEDATLTATLAAALTIIHRSASTPLYGMRRNAPPPRRVGPYDILDEE